MYKESSKIVTNGVTHLIEKYENVDKIYCYCQLTKKPINFNGAIGEEIHGECVLYGFCQQKECK